VLKTALVGASSVAAGSFATLAIGADTSKTTAAQVPVKLRSGDYPRFRGPFPILSTPYTDSGAVDFEVLARSARFVDWCESPGMIWPQSNDSIDLLTRDEKLEGMETLARTSRDLKTTALCLGVQGKDTDDMLVYARHAKTLASTAVISRPPDTGKTQDDLRQYWRALAEVITDRPVMIQTHGRRGAATPTTGLLIELAKEFPNFGYFEHMDRIGVPDLWLDNNAVKREGYSTDLITEDAIAFMETHRKKPFFLYLSHAAPHFPYQGPNDCNKVVKPKTKAWQQGDRKTYVAMVGSMDRGIGKVLAKLDELNLRDNTLVVFTSDNGGSTWSRNTPLRGSKSTIWEGGVRVPCLARWPGKLSQGKVLSQVGITMDWTATFRRLAGLGRDRAGEDGIDLLPILTGKVPMRERTLFWRRKKGPVRKNVEEGLAIRQGQWKLVKQATGKRYLFNLDEDVGEARNLLDQHPDLAARLNAELAAWEDRIDGR
jgi:hypothetical protein